MQRWLTVSLIYLALLLVLAPTQGTSASSPVLASQDGMPSVRGGPVELPTQPVAETRAGEWVQTTTAHFSAGERDQVDITNVDDGELRLAAGASVGTYVAPVIAADFSFNAIVAQWAADVPQGSDLEIEVRTFDQVSGWSDWKSFTNVEWIALRGRYYPETPIMVSTARQFQYRMTMSAGSSGGVLTGAPVLRRVTITYLDTSMGPTTAQAKFRMQAQDVTAHGVMQPSIISRAGWGADESLRDWDPEVRPVRKIVVHHTVTPNDYAEDESAAWVRAIYHYHTVTRGWGDIGYNYLIDQYGNIYEGRFGGPGAVGGHVYSYNYGSVGIALIGTHGNASNSIAPSAAAAQALTRLCVWEASRSFVNPLESASFFGSNPPNLGGHRDYPPNETTCPGDLAYAILPGLRQGVWDGLVVGLPRYQVAWLTSSMSSDELKQGVLEAGKEYALTLEVRNVGWYTWPHTENSGGVRLGYHWLDSSGQAVTMRPEQDLRAVLGHDVSYGNTYEFASARVVAPETPGIYTLAWDLVHEGNTWFHDANAKSPLLTMGMTVTGASPGDSGVIRNGGFEQGGDWTLFQTAYSAQFTDRVKRTGARSLQTGDRDAGANVFSYSSAEQAFDFPLLAISRSAIGSEPQ